MPAHLIRPACHHCRTVPLCVSLRLYACLLVLCVLAAYSMHEVGGGGWPVPCFPAASCVGAVFASLSTCNRIWVCACSCMHSSVNRDHGGVLQREDHDHSRVRHCLPTAGNLLLCQVWRLRSHLGEGCGRVEAGSLRLSHPCAACCRAGGMRSFRRGGAGGEGGGVCVVTHQRMC